MAAGNLSSETFRANFLQSFAAADGVFDLGGRVSPGSIRDQVIRAKLFVSQLAEFGFLNFERDPRKTCKVCVVGAGPAGLTVAIEASRFENVEVWLVDRNPHPLSILAKDSKHFISPTLYDWPARHSRLERYFGNPPYQEGYPAEIRDRWLDATALENRPGLRWIRSFMADPRIDEPGSPRRVKFTPVAGRVSTAGEKNVPAEEEFDIVVLCRGFGLERGIDITPNPLHPRGGILMPHPFWEEDPYPLNGYPSLPKWQEEEDIDCAVAVLGGGDGAMQETLRLITNGYDTRHILRAFEAELSSPDALKIMADMAGQIENEARHAAFAPRPEHFSRELGSQMERLIAHISTDALLAKLNAMVYCRQIRMYFKGAALGRCYALNRFLVLLFRECIRRYHNWDILGAEHEVKSVECLHAGEDHFKEKHVLRFVNGVEVRCRVIVPRIGLDESKRPKCHRRFDHLYHALPYWLSDWAPAAWHVPAI